MRNEREKHREQEGFTLVELICVIAMIGYSHGNSPYLLTIISRNGLPNR